MRNGRSKSSNRWTHGWWTRPISASVSVPCAPIAWRQVTGGENCDNFILSTSMEANLNQFRLLTVRGEQEANNNRRSSCGRHLHDYHEYHDCASSLAGGDSGGSTRSVNNGGGRGGDGSAVCVSGGTSHDVHDKRVVTDDSGPPSARSSPRRTQRRRTTARVTRCVIFVFRFRDR